MKGFDLEIEVCNQLSVIDCRFQNPACQPPYELILSSFDGNLFLNMYSIKELVSIRKCR